MDKDKNRLRVLATLQLETTLSTKCELARVRRQRICGPPRSGKALSDGDQLYATPPKNGVEFVTLHDGVLCTLNALCEKTGIFVDSDGEIEVSLGHIPVWVRVHESPGAISIYRRVVRNAPDLAELCEKLNDLNDRLVLFRVVWRDEKLFLRADLPAAPFSAEHLQVVLENFETEADALMAELEDGS